MAKCGDNIAMVDLWMQNETHSGPAHGLNNSRAACSQAHQGKGCIFEDDMFGARVVDIIMTHDLSRPLFLFWAPHAVHGPRQCPEATYSRFIPIIPDPQRRMYAALTNHLDTLLGQAVQALETRGMLNNTLIVMSSDNGGDDSANNWPLRGAKFSNWEGGIHVRVLASDRLESRIPRRDK